MWVANRIQCMQTKEIQYQKNNDPNSAVRCKTRAFNIKTALPFEVRRQIEDGLL